MSRGLDEGPREEEERIAPRRSQRTRKAVRPFKGFSEEESGESETETGLWKIGNEVVREEVEIDGDKDSVVEVESEPRKEVEKADKMSTPDAGLGDFMRLYIEEQQRRDERREGERREENNRREEERREERKQREIERAEAREREERLWRTVNRAPATPEPVAAPRSAINLPKMHETEEVTEFLPKFELALRLNKVPVDQRKVALISHVPIESLIKCKTQVDIEECSYEELIGALSNSSTLTFSAAAEELCTGERGRVWEMEGRKAGARVKALLGQITRDADDKEEIIECISVALLRDKLVTPLKAYVDSSRRFEYPEFMNTCEEWEKGQLTQTCWFKKNRANVGNTGRPGNSSSFQQSKKSITCYSCGKGGHVSRECRSRPQVEAATAPVATAAPAAPTSSRALADITCFRCKAKGHKSPECPTRPKGNRRVQVPVRTTQCLESEELFGYVGKWGMGITVDTGAQVSIVPIECVEPCQLLGVRQTVKTFEGTPIEGEACMVQFRLGDRCFDREAVAIAGELIHWTPCFRVPLTPRTDMEFLMNLAEEKGEGEQLYVPPQMHQGRLLSGYMVSGESGLTDKVVTSESTPKEDSSKMVKGVADDVASVEKECASLGAIDISENEVDSGDSNVNEEEIGDHGYVEEAERDGDLGLREDGASASVEEDGGTLGGRAEQEEQLVIEGIKGNRSVLVEETGKDESLHVARGLAARNQEGYSYKDGVIMRSRLDKAHTKFGHMGRNKMCQLITPYFYWPNLAKDCKEYIRSCDVCQRNDKTRPPVSPMQTREIVTVPFERVAIDLVGPFPSAKGGFKYMLTCVDLATRWPEAIPIRTCTARVIIDKLVDVFTHNGYPKTIVSDSKTFSKWLTQNGIRHVKSSPYHPQGNGVVERLHRTLGAIVTKTTGAKGNWASVVPRALYFIRAVPCEATGLSPFVAKQGWEPSTPLSLLYESWLDCELEGLDLAEFVIQNSERIEQLRESSSLRLRETGELRKSKWDVKSKERVFKVNDEVLMRKAGLCGKLESVWEGPYRVYQVNSRLSYGVDTGDRKIPSVHISLMKEYKNQEELAKIARATTVMESDTVGDEIGQRYAEVKVSGSEGLSKGQRIELDEILGRYEGTLTKEPGLTDLAVFSIDTGTHTPIHQQPYSTPAHFRTSIDTELDWLLEKGFIRPSTSPWASPIVAVRKPDGSARLCVDFKKVNAITQDQPFYMPRVEEVLEGVGKSLFISKLDLSKGYYQVRMSPEDIQKTAFVCHRGRYEFLRMPFGVKNAPACFQEVMQNLFMEEAHCTPYMDDLVVFSESWEDHLAHIEGVLRKLESAGLTANPRKCVWGGKQLDNWQLKLRS